MKAKIIIFSILALLFGKIDTFAQSVNQLSIPVIDGRLGKELSVPVSMTNDSEITGIQVNIHFPQGAQVNINSVALSDRKDNHTVTARSLGNGNYLFVIFSASNKLIKGNSGVVFTIPVNIPMDWEENSLHPFAFNHVIISSVQGDNLATGFEPGAIRVVAEQRPDFTVENVQVNKSSLNPGDKFTASWTVKNTGDEATTGGWSEQISLVDDNGKQTPLGSLHQDGIISTGNSVNRQAEFALSQLPGMEGNVKLSVRIIPNADAGELPGDQGNNTAKSAQYLTINKKLLLELPQYAIPENNTASIQCKLSRSGDWSEQQVFTLSTDYPQRISLPASVTIPAQQSGAFFYFQVTDNTILDLDSLVAITVSGNGYEAVTGKIIIEDNESASLSLTASKSEINEGEEFTLTVERERESASELIVYLNCNYPKRFNFPAQITIPAGQKSASAAVTVIDDNVPDMTRDIEFTASASKHQNAKLNIVLYDNDVPEIALTLTPQTVSESAGPLAVKAVLRRLTKKDGNITVALSDNSNGGLYYSTSRLTLAPGIEEAQFTIGVIDNAIMEGDRTVDVTAAVYISSCNCSASGTSAGVVQAQLTILDDDGPALKIISSQTMLQEGRTNASILTVTRNTPTTQSLTVTVSSDHDDDLIYDKTVTIPAGSESVEIPVSVRANETTEGDRTVVFTATADGFTKGTCWVMITDQTLPDAVISSISLSDAELQAEGGTTVQIVVTNAGAAALPQVPVNIYSSLSSTSLMSVQTHKALAVNESDTITQNLTMPNATGNHTIHAAVNETQSVKELTYLNNTSEKVSIRLLPKFTATAATDKTVYKQGEAVIISGQLTGNGTANAVVEVYLINSGIRQTIEATTDASGRYQLTFQPSVYQSGHFTAGACYPKEGLSVEQAGFDIYGIKRADSGYITHDLTVGEPYQGTIQLTNTGTLPLSNLKAEITAAPENAAIVFTPVSSVSGNATVALNYTLTGNAPSEGADWQHIKIKISSDESELLDLLIYAYFRTAKGKLEANISSIQTTMTKDASRDYPLTITNKGKGETGKISLSLPANAAWMSTATPREMTSLGANESATIVLRFTPTDNLALNVPLTGTIGVNCENGIGFPLSYSVEPVSESTGTLEIDVCDEYTYYTEEAPHLAGAKVVLKHPVTGAVIREGTTNPAGLFTMNNLPEGYYALEVSAEKHDSYKNNILVDPGKTTKKVVNLSFQAITITWDVEDTEVEDEYDITTTVTYETNVPVPVVVTEYPDKIEYKNQIFNVYVTNKGLISAKQVELKLPSVNGVVFEILAEHPIASLAPQQSMVIPVKMTVDDNFYWGNPVPISDETCVDIRIKTIWHWICGGEDRWNSTYKIYRYGKCTTTPPIPPPPGPGGPEGPASGGVGGGEGNGGGGYINIIDDCGESGTVCATISLQFSQTMTMTRQAFRGTLTVYNGHESLPMENVRLNLLVKDENGKVATSHEFQINNESLKEFGGDLNGYWTLDAHKTGTATIVFIPTKYAAPTDPVKYSFGGSLSYTDPFTGLEVTRDLYPVTLTVKPSPNLDLTYFMQRDILGDDPLTPEIEPMVPAEFSLLIHNVGVGEATNIRMITQQPKIVDNEKGLFINFELLSSQLNGGEHTMALGGSVPTEFGNISSGKTTYAQWWFTGSLLGHFTSYDVQATHVTSYGNPDLTLLNEVSIHELIRSIRTQDTDHSLLAGFMVNDIPDSEDLPDRLYLSNGTIETVSLAGISCAPEGSNQYRLTVTPSAIGWNYGTVNDPTGGRQQLTEIRRVSDNAVIDLRNCWQTDRTLRDGRDPLYENKLHLADKFGSGSEHYLLSFTPRSDMPLIVETFTGVPESVSSTAVQEITVRFNKNINAATFTTDDIRLICQGESVDAGLISITPVDERTFKLGLSAVTQSSGYYVLTVQTSGIMDYEGYQGETGKTADWNQYIGGKVQFDLKIEPENGGTVTPPAGQYDFNSVLNLQAVPNEGYLFEKWSINGEILSTNPAYNFTLISGKTLTATFKLKLYDVTVGYDKNAGNITGGGSGKYEHGSRLILRAEPLTGYTFGGWTVNGEDKPNQTLDVIVEANIIIEAHFIQNNLNTAPTGLALSKQTFRQDTPVGAAIGGFTTEDANGNDTFTYNLVSGTNDTHNALFAVRDDSLVTNDNFVCKKDETYHIRVRTTDSGNLSFEKTFDLSMIRTTVIDSTHISGSICQGETYPFFGTNLAVSGRYEHILQNVQGCDSVIVLNLTVSPRPAAPVISVEGTHTLVSSAASGNQWYDEDGAIGNATAQSFTPSVSGTYYVIVTSGNCESSPSDSYFVNLSNEIKIEWNFTPQWNWFSINSMQPTPIESLLTPVKNKIDRIVGRNSEAVNGASGFTGNLTTLMARESYKFKVNASGTMTLNGAVSPVEDNPIQLNAGWNWIGYLPVVGLTSADALSGLSPSTNDVVKNQTDFSVYNGQRWIGTLTGMKPGEGYMYFSASPRSFTYPSLRAAKVENLELRASEAANWEYDAHQYSDNMNVIARLLVNGQVSGAGAYTVGAFRGNECRGIGKYADGHLFITVHGENTSDIISFKAYENATGKEYAVEETLAFSDVLKGTFSQPVTLTLKTTTSLDNPKQSDLAVYPNPVRESLYLSGSNLDMIKNIKILTITGSVIWATDNYNNGQGINISFLSNGSYILAVRMDNEIIYRKFVKSNP